MKNRNIQFKPTAGLLIPLLLACFAAVFISTSNPASAGDQVPFNGTLSGCVDTQEPVDQCTIHTHALLFGNATQLGAFTGTGEFYQNFCEDPPNITYIGSFHLFAANGDELAGTFEGYLSPTETPGVYDNHETSDVTGAQVASPAPPAIGTRAGKSTSPRSRCVLPPPCKDGSQVSARTGGRGCAPDLRIATSVRLVAMPKIDEETCHFPIRRAASHRRSRTQDSAIGSEIHLDSLSRTCSGRRRDTQHRFQTFFATRRKV